MKHLRDAKWPNILAGHSYNGLVITGAANQAPNVAALVYFAAFGLDEGESIDGLSQQGPATPGAAQIRPDKPGFLWIGPAGFPQKPLSIKSFTAKCGPPAWKHIPSWYMVSGNDQMIPPQAEEMMAKRMGATVRTVSGSHAAIVSCPKRRRRSCHSGYRSATQRPRRKLGIVSGQPGGRAARAETLSY